MRARLDVFGRSKISKQGRAMVEIAGLYFVVANANRARFVRPGPDNRLHTIKVVDDAAVGKRDDEAPEEPNPNVLVGLSFARLLARRISDDQAADLFTHLVIVAPPIVLDELTAMLDPPAGASLIGRLARDLTTVPDLELWPYLDEWVRSRCRV
jgi:hypothetical protein